MTALAAVSVCEAIRPLLPDGPRIKWPNDVLIGERKICGILVEQRDAAVMGIGVNVNISQAEFDEASLTGATSLAIVAGCAFETEYVAGRLIASLDEEYRRLLAGGEAELQKRWVSRMGLLGRRVSIELINGQRRSGRLAELTFSRIAWNEDAGPSGSAARNKSATYGAAIMRWPSLATPSAGLAAKNRTSANDENRPTVQRVNVPLSKPGNAISRRTK